MYIHFRKDINNLLIHCVPNYYARLVTCWITKPAIAEVGVSYSSSFVLNKLRTSRKAFLFPATDKTPNAFLLARFAGTETARKYHRVTTDQCSFSLFILLPTSYPLNRNSNLSGTPPTFLMHP